MHNVNNIAMISNQSGIFIFFSIKIHLKNLQSLCQLTATAVTSRVKSS